MDVTKIVDPKSYREFAGASWPSYEDFVRGELSSDPAIAKEITDFVAVMVGRYENLRLGEGDRLAKENQQRQGQVFFDKNLKTVSPCRVPWETLGVNSNGELFICSSPSWIPKFVGNIINIGNIYSALNSPTALSIRQEILAGRYYYCNNTICSFFAKIPRGSYTAEAVDQTPLEPTDNWEDLLVKQVPKNLIFDFDYTCNFKCPSCRTELINWNRHHLIRPINDQIVDKIKHLIIDEIKTQPVSIRWAGGEPFLSEPYLDLFEYIIASGKTNIQNIIQTNGSYLNSKVVRGLLPYISELRISFDAATAETYALTRVNGNWTKLLDNVQYVMELKRELGVATRISADFVVQKDNYQEIPEFVDLCRQLGITFTLQKMWNWGTWDDATFAEKNVYQPEHPEYQELKRYFQQAGQFISN